MLDKGMNQKKVKCRDVQKEEKKGKGEEERKIANERKKEPYPDCKVVGQV